jgi:hypothetical protein
VTCATAVAVFFLPKHWTADIFCYANETSGTGERKRFKYARGRWEDGSWWEVGEV